MKTQSSALHLFLALVILSSCHASLAQAANSQSPGTGNTTAAEEAPPASNTASTETATPVPSPPIQVIVQTPEKSIWSDLISPLAGLFGVLVGSLLALRIQSAKIRSEQVEADRKYLLERIREIYSVTLTVLDASTHFHQRFLEIIQARQADHADSFTILIRAKESIAPLKDAGQRCFAYTFLDMPKNSDLAKQIHESINSLYARLMNYVTDGRDNGSVLREIEELDKITNEHLKQVSDFYEKHSGRTN